MKVLAAVHLGAAVEFVLLWIVIAVITSIIAVAKGRSFIGWFLIGFLFSLFALVLVIVLPSNWKSRPRRRGQKTKTCPDCAEEILEAANVCKHCGLRFDGTRVEPRLTD